jgi:hypothetical protein
MRSISSADPIRSDTEPPACPDWCEHAPTGHGWDEMPGAVTKLCAGSTDIGPNGSLQVQRYASLGCDGLAVDAPVVRLEFVGELSPEAAHALSVRLAEAARTANGLPIRAVAL